MTARVCEIDSCDRLHLARGMCRKHYSARRYQENKEAMDERSRGYRAANPEKVVSWRRSYWRKNPEHVRALSRAADRRYREANPEHVREMAVKRTRKYREANPDAWRNRRLKHHYGITVDDYDTMLAAQNGCCAICGLPSSDGKRLDVDHDHESGVVRGLLCRRHNVALGHFHDSAEHLRAAIEYLERER